MARILFVFLAVAMSAAVAAQNAHTESTLWVDLGAVIRADRVQPVDGISSAGQPNEAALGVFAASGYTTVIDLRSEREDRGLDESSVIEGLGMDYIQLPIAGADAINFKNAAALERLIKAAGGPVLVHCGSGNRVGALLSLRKSLEGATDAVSLEYGKAGGLTRLEGRVKEVLATSLSME